jgi:putative transposase
MKKSKFTEEQIAFALHQAEMGTSVEEVCRKIGIAQATFYVWKKKYGGIGVSELRRLRQLEEENRKLKQLVADLSLDKVMLQDVLKKSSEANAAQTAPWPSDKSVRGQCQARLRRVSAKQIWVVRQVQNQIVGCPPQIAHAGDC